MNGRLLLSLLGRLGCKSIHHMSSIRSNSSSSSSSSSSSLALKPFKHNYNYNYNCNYNGVLFSSIGGNFRHGRMMSHAASNHDSGNSKDDKREGGEEKSLSNKMTEKMRGWKQHFIEGCVFYWNGTKLLWTEMKVAAKLQRRVLNGQTLTRRERAQLVKTTSDMFRLVPFMVFVIVPFMEFTLPFFLKFFPNMLPSTYQDSLQKEETLKKKLTLKLEMAKFLQEATVEFVKSKASDTKDKEKAKEFLNFMNKIHSGDHVSTHEIATYSDIFADDFTLSKLNRFQLQAMCRFMGITTLGTDEYLRFQIRRNIRQIRLDDEEIQNESVESMTSEELRHALNARGIRTDAESDRVTMLKKMNEWLKFSLDNKIPNTLLILSQALLMTGGETHKAEALSDTIREVATSVLGEEEGEFAKRVVKEEDAKKRAQIQENLQKILKEEHEEYYRKHSGDISEITNLALNIADVRNKMVDKFEFETGSERKNLSDSDLKELILAVKGFTTSELMSKESEELLKVRKDLDEFMTSLETSKKITADDIIEDGEEKKKENNTVPVTSSDIQRAQKIRSTLEKFTDKLQNDIKAFNLAHGEKFNILDLDQDGVVSLQELNIALKFLKKKYDVTDIHKTLESLDTDKDGKIPLADLEKVLQMMEAKRNNNNNTTNNYANNYNIHNNNVSK